MELEQAKPRVLDRAIKLAVEAHSGMQRKKDGVPYILHPMEVAVIAGTLTKDEDVLAAAVLHDVVEDTGVTLEDIRRECGDRVAEIVAAETEDKRLGQSPKDTWKLRKAESLRELESSERPEVKILWLADKLANMRSFYRMWRQDGNAMWTGFNENRPSEQAWYYRTIDRLLEDMRDTDAWKEYHRIVETMFGRVQE